MRELGLVIRKSRSVRGNGPLCGARSRSPVPALANTSRLHQAVYAWPIPDPHERIPAHAHRHLVRRCVPLVLDR